MGGGDMFDEDDDDDSEFRVDGTFVPGMGATSKAGTYRVVITQFGRTADGYIAPSLGPVLQRLPPKIQHHQQQFGGMPGMGGMMGGMGGMMGGFRPPMNPMGQGFWGGQGGHMKRNVGEMHNAAIIGTSASVFSDHITGISKNNLIGRGVALCRGGHHLGGDMDDFDGGMMLGVGGGALGGGAVGG